MPSRRQFLVSGAVAGMGLVIGLRLDRASAQGGTAAPAVLAPNAFVRIAPDNTVTIIAKHIELGQGAHTGLATLLAEELDADWSQIRVEEAPIDVARYNNLAWGPMQGTGGSTSMANSWEQLRRAGATARAMLIAAAAQRWKVPAGEITVDRGVLAHAASGRRATFGELASDAARQTPPAQVTLKDPKDFKLIGRHAPRVDSRAKTTGSAEYTYDVRLPDMLTAVIARPPRFGATVKSFDASAARRVPGVTDVVPVPSGVAVVARGAWAAIKGRSALRIDWDETAAERRGSAELYAAYRVLAAQPGARARRQGDPEAALAGAARVLEAVYEFPYLAHTPMEPLDCVVRLGADGCEVWIASQTPIIEQQAVAAVFGLPSDKVRIHTLLAGGSFGRRSTARGDVAVEAASVAKALGRRADDQAHLDPRGRYPGRFLSAPLRTPAARGAGWGRSHRGVGTPDRGTVSRHGDAARSPSHPGRDRPHLRRGRRQSALCHPEHRRGAAHHHGGHPRALVALGGQHAYRVLHRDLPGRGGPRRRP